MLADRHQHLAAEMAALLLGRQLVLEMHARGARLDHRPHQLIGVERAAEPGLGVGDDRRHPVGAIALALAHRDLVGAAQRGVDAADHIRDGVRRDKATGRDTSAPPCWRRRRPASRRDRSPSARP